jgi:uncharacterized protein YuzE
MKISYFKAIDTLYVALSEAAIAGTRDLDTNTVIDVDDEGNICAITVEHASEGTDVSRVIVEGMAA